MSIGSLLKDKIFNIFIAVAVCIISFILMILSNIGMQYSIFIEIIIISGFTIEIMLEVIRKYRYYNKVKSDFDEIEEKSYIIEMIDKPDFNEGKVMYNILKSQCKYLNDKIAEYDKKYKEYEEYIELWIHEVKTPISTSKLLIENNKDVTTLSIAEEIDKIDDYVEQVLYYAKSDSVERDYKIKRLYLKNIVMGEIKKKSKSIINSRMRPIIRDLDYYVLADSKWISFILGQIISNSIKYKSQDSFIEIYAEKNEDEKIVLNIKDNGIGIHKEDIDRVFERGFTGINGRDNYKSTGMGLYICKNLCEKMNIDIGIESVVGEGTTIKLIFTEAIAD